MKKTELTSNEHSKTSMALLAFLVIVAFGGVNRTRAQWTNGTNINNTNSGNVGIGTTNPTQKLDVVGNILLDNSSGWYGINKASGEARAAMFNGALLSDSDYLYFGSLNNGFKFVNSSNSPLVTILNGGNVGIGTTSPQAIFNVSTSSGAIENLDSSNSTGGYGAFYDTVGTRTVRGFVGFGPTLFATGDNTLFGLRSQGALTFATNGGYRQMLIDTSGNVGIGTTSPYTKLQVAGGDISVDADHGIRKAGDNWIIGYSTTLPGIAIGSGTTTDQVTIQAGGVERLRVLTNGNVGIGNNNPQYKLDVNGTINSNSTITGNNIVAKYQDVAEWVPSSEQLTAGTVVVLDSTKSNQVISSSQSDHTRVAGVISAQPGIALGEKSDSKVLVATTGRVKVKVDASKSPIHIGDLLVTSDVPGVAMKSKAVNLGGVQIHRPGTLIGKALEPLAKGKGEILVLLSLQ